MADGEEQVEGVDREARGIVHLHGGLALVGCERELPIAGEQGTVQLLILSQVVLSMQLSFAVFPLLQFTSDRAKMGEFVNAPWAKVLGYGIGVVIAGLNVYLLYQTFVGA